MSHIRPQIVWAALLVSLALPAQSAQAHHAIGGLGGGGISTIPGSTLERGQWSLLLQSIYLDFDAYTDEELLALHRQRRDTHSLDFSSGTFLTGAYGLTDNITLALRLPYFYLDDIRELHSHGHGAGHAHEVENEGDSDGIGDLLGLAAFRLLNAQDETLQVSLLAGLEFPTGRTHVRNKDGERFETDHQPGSGSWDPLVGLALSKAWERWSLHTSALYQFNTEGAQDAELGDIFTYDVAFVYRLIGYEPEEGGPSLRGPGMARARYGSRRSDDSVRVVRHDEGEEGHSHDDGHTHDDGHDHDHCHHHHDHWHGPTLDLIFEFNGLWEGTNRFGTVIDENHGGNVIYFSPGFRYTPREHLALFFSGGIPIAQNPNGSQQRVDYRLIGGFSVWW